MASLDEKNSSLEEKGGVEEFITQDDDKHQLDVSDRDHVKRKLNQRHVQMIAVCFASYLLIHC